MSSRGLLGAALLGVVAVVAAGCGSKESWQLMAQEPRYEPFEPSEFFPDGSSARHLPPGTVARGELRADPLLHTGDLNGKVSTELPFPLTRALLDRGQERFDIYCSPCHGRTGYGDGMVVRRGFTRPPNFHQDRLRAAPIGHFFQVMSDGFGAMPSYAKQVSVRDRWAIAAYIRALQLSQHATLDDVPADRRAELGQGGGGR